MNEIERQILLNQVSIMRKLNHPGCDGSLDINLQNTSDLLNPKDEQTQAERTEHIFGKESEDRQ